VPVLTAATATAREILLGLGLDPVIPDAGRLLAAEISAAV
jgi:maleate isomerase